MKEGRRFGKIHVDRKKKRNNKHGVKEKSMNKCYNKVLYIEKAVRQQRFNKKVQNSDKK